MANEKNLLDFPTTTSAESADWVHIQQGGVDKKISLADFITELNGGNPFNITVREESGSNRILTIADKNAYIRCLNATQTTIQVKNAQTVGWKKGDSIVFRKEGLGNVLMAADSGVTIRSAASGLSLTEVGQAGQLICVDDTPTATIFDFVTGGNARASVTGSITFLTVDAMKNGATNDGLTVDFAELAANNTLVETIYNNTTSKKGGAKYIIKTLSQAAVDGDTIDGSGVPDNFGANHELVDGIHCAIIVDDYRLPVQCFGVIAGASGNPAAFNKVINYYASKSRTLYVNDGIYRTTHTTRLKYHGLGRMQDTSGNTATNFIKISQGDTDKDSAPVSCIIRQDTASGGWYFIDDSGHAPNGFSSIATTDNRIVLDLHNTQIKIQSVVLNPDSTYAKQGISCGIFVSTSKVFIELFKEFFANINNDAGSGEWSTYFGSEPTVTKNANGTITVTHPEVVATSQAPILSMGNISSVSGQVPCLISFDTTSVTYGMYAGIAGSLVHGGGTWTANTQAFNVPTVTTDGGDGFILNHETIRQVGLSVSPSVDSPYIVSSSAIDKNKTRIVFRDFSGTIINTPLDNMKIYYQGVDLVLQKTPYGNTFIRRPSARLNPDLLFSPLGNFWITGNFQV